ncbi:sulfur carrier protein ThiS [Orbaceae bacterium ESL0727]|nr:sulfur carrier protein ThiS [Orbaceae bacterium ESL0727]
MSITINDIETEFYQPQTIIALLEQLKQPTIGIALAINQTIIPKDEWATYQVQDNDSIIIFQAIAGG